MNTAKVTHQIRLSTWSERIREQMDSGLSIKDWCAQNDIRLDRFYYWKRKLKESCLESALPDIVPLGLPEPVHSYPTSTTSNPDPMPAGDQTFTSCTTAPVKLRIGDASIEIYQDIPSDLITKVIKAVRYA